MLVCWAYVEWRIKYSLKVLKQGLLYLNNHDKYLKYILIKKCSNVRIPKSYMQYDY